MKKTIVLALFCFYLSGCVPLDRVNPTDPKASNFYGFEFTGNMTDSSLFSIGDFVFNGSDVFLVDTIGGRAHKIGGSESYSWAGSINISGTDYPILDNPAGICFDGSYIYITDANTHNLQVFATVPDISVSKVVSVPQSAGKIACDNTYLYIASTEPGAPEVRRYLKSAVMSAALGGAVTHDAVFDTTGIVEISDIEVHHSGNVLVADRGTRRIVRFTSAGAQAGSMSFTFLFTGFGVTGDRIYMPHSSGITEADYASGAVLRTFANYGEGEGRIEAFGPAEASGDKIAAVRMKKISVFLKH